MAYMGRSDSIFQGRPRLKDDDDDDDDIRVGSAALAEFEDVRCWDDSFHQEG
jgi:hypothetical protein